MSILAMASFRATKCCHLVGEQEVHDGVQQSPSVPDLYYILTCFFYNVVQFMYILRQVNIFC